MKKKGFDRDNNFLPLGFEVQFGLGLPRSYFSKIFKTPVQLTQKRERAVISSKSYLLLFGKETLQVQSELFVMKIS